MKQPRKLSLVTLTEESKEHWQESDPTRFGSDTFVFLGEIPNMQGHCIVMEHTFGNTSPKVHIGYHTDNFRELTEDEV